jgi:hypothetical protein
MDFKLLFKELTPIEKLERDYKRLSEHYARCGTTVVVPPIVIEPPETRVVVKKTKVENPNEKLIEFQQHLKKAIARWRWLRTGRKPISVITPPPNVTRYRQYDGLGAYFFRRGGQPGSFFGEVRVNGSLLYTIPLQGDLDTAFYFTSNAGMPTYLGNPSLANFGLLPLTGNGFVVTTENDLAQLPVGYQWHYLGWRKTGYTTWNATPEIIMQDTYNFLAGGGTDPGTNPLTVTINIGDKV